MASLERDLLEVLNKHGLALPYGVRLEAEDDVLRLKDTYNEVGEVAMHSADVFDPHYMSLALHDLPPAASLQAERILGHEGPLWQALNKFLRRNAEYGEAANVLGVKGQFADINRKVIKLKRFMWDDEPMPDGAESIHTIVCELIGHLLLVLDEMDQADRRDKMRDEDRGPSYPQESD